MKRGRQPTLDIGPFAGRSFDCAVQQRDDLGVTGNEGLGKCIERTKAGLAVRPGPLADDQQLPRSCSVDAIRDRTAGCPGESSLEGHLASLGRLARLVSRALWVAVSHTWVRPTLINSRDPARDVAERAAAVVSAMRAALGVGRLGSELEALLKTRARIEQEGPAPPWTPALARFAADRFLGTYFGLGNECTKLTKAALDAAR